VKTPYTPEEDVAQYQADSKAGHTVEGPCPFCAGTYTTPRVSVVTHRINYLAHSIPYCRNFDRMGPLEFLQAANKMRGH
jgi:hypothetical protein